MSWTQQSRAAKAAEMRRAWRACRELAGCVCVGTRHDLGCPLRRMPQDRRSRAGWTNEARRVAAARCRASWEALGPKERERLIARLQSNARKAAKRRRGRWTRERRMAQAARMRQVWQEWRAGTRPLSAAQAQFLQDMGMWPKS